MAANGAYEVINGVRMLMKPRTYVLELTHDALALSTVSGVISIDASSPFLMTDQFMSCDQDPALLAPGLQGQYNNEIQVQDSSNGYLWSDGFQSRAGFARDRTRGNRLKRDVFIDANTRLSITLRNPAAAAAAGVTKIELQGYALVPA